MTQMSTMKCGNREFGDAGVDAVLQDLRKLHDRIVLEPHAASSCLSDEDTKGALPYLIFLMKKRNGTIKDRGSANGRKQRLNTAKEDASTPTVAIESGFLTCVIETNEQ
jgi:hypothetical protein